MTQEQGKTTGKSLQVRGLCKSYGKQQVLHDLDLTIEPGCIYGLIGRNGAGKTTLLSILTGQNTKDAGTVTYGGEEVWENQAVLQDLCFTRELSSSSETAQIAVKRYLRAAELFCPHWDKAYAAELIEKFDLPLKKQVGKLSKGQMSMLSIVAALASRAPITLLDEPAAGLDVVARERFYRILLEEYTRTGRTFLISTHIIEEAAGVFERVVILDRGKILEDLPTEELVGQFRYVSGAEEAVDRALGRVGLRAVQTQTLGRHKMVAVRGREEDFAKLAQDPDVDVTGMNLQNVFVALCGHGDEEG